MLIACWDSQVTVSLYDTIGSDFIIGILANFSSRSLQAISAWSSPDAASTISPLLSLMKYCRRGSDLISFNNPSINLGNSFLALGFIAI